MEKQSKYIYIHTFGCQMNDYDSERILNILSFINYKPVDDYKKADLIILNTCSIREKAESKVYSKLGLFKKMKKENPLLIIGVCGCVAQQEGERLLKKFPYLDFVIGTHNIHKLPQIISEIEIQREQVSFTDFISDTSLRFINPLSHTDSIYDDISHVHTERQNKPRPTLRVGTPGAPILSGRSDAPIYRGATTRQGSNEGMRSYDALYNKVTSFVTIMEGCNNFCTYCIVPYVRGREISRPSDDIINDIKILAEKGVREITLLGQNVNSYGLSRQGKINFPALLRFISAIEGIERIRFMTSHPKDLSMELINCFAELGKLCEHIHLPIQSGSNKILEMMGRKYTREDYLKMIEALRKINPNISITSDIIVGFPGESDEDFRKTLSLIENVEYDSIFSFNYSPRPETVASRFKDQISEEIKSQRLIELQEIQNRITFEKNRSMENSVKEILVEDFSKRGKNMLTGRLRTNKVVNFCGDKNLLGKTVNVRIAKAYQNTLIGELV